MTPGQLVHGSMLTECGRELRHRSMSYVWNNEQEEIKQKYEDFAFEIIKPVAEEIDRLKRELAAERKKSWQLLLANAFPQKEKGFSKMNQNELRHKCDAGFAQTIPRAVTPVAPPVVPDPSNTSPGAPCWVRRVDEWTAAFFQQWVSTPTGKSRALVVIRSDDFFANGVATEVDLWSIAFTAKRPLAEKED